VPLQFTHSFSTATPHALSPLSPPPIQSSTTPLYPEQPIRSLSRSTRHSTQSRLTRYLAKDRNSKEKSRKIRARVWRNHTSSSRLPRTVQYVTSFYESAQNADLFSSPTSPRLTPFHPLSTPSLPTHRTSPRPRLSHNSTFTPTYPSSPAGQV